MLRYRHDGREGAFIMTTNQQYQDGRTDGRAYARTHTADERAQELIRARERLADYPMGDEWYLTGYIEILENWTEGEGA